MRLSRSTFFALIALAGCGGEASTTDAGPTDARIADARIADARVTEDASNPTCDVDRGCPEAAPVWGGPCEGALSCPFISACGAGSEDVYECVAATWSLTMPAPCAGGSPPLAESCREPSTGTIADGRVWISADRAGAPELIDGASVEVAFGAQGSAMIPYRVHVEGTDVPSCIAVTTTLSLDTMTSTPALHRVRLRCGSSLRIQDVLPDLPCDEREYAVGIDVVVAGAPAMHLDLVAMGGGCMFSG